GQVEGDPVDEVVDAVGAAGAADAVDRHQRVVAGIDHRHRAAGGGQRGQAPVTAVGGDLQAPFGAGGGGGQHEHVARVAAHEGRTDAVGTGLLVDGIANVGQRALALGDGNRDGVAVADADGQRA